MAHGHTCGIESADYSPADLCREPAVNQEDNEMWLLDVGHSVIEKMVDRGYASLSSVERLIYCLWVADYGMRNAGDLAVAFDRHWPFLEHARLAATQLGLRQCIAAFSLSASDREQQYFQLFDGLCQEIRDA